MKVIQNSKRSAPLDRLNTNIHSIIDFDKREERDAF